MAEGLKQYSRTPADNNDTPPQGMPEGMAPGLVNDSVREFMANARISYEENDFVDIGHVPTFVNATSFTVTEDVTSIYTAGRRVKLTSPTNIVIAQITSSSFSSPNTTVNITVISGTYEATVNEVAYATVSPESVDVEPADGSITEEKLADDSVTTDKIADENVTLGKLERAGTATQVLTSNGSGSAPSYQDAPGGATLPQRDVFTSSGTYTLPANASYLEVHVVGGGGGSGGSGSNDRAGSGGGGGGYARLFIDASSISATEPVTVGTGGNAGGAGLTTGGTGGTSSFSSFCSATGGAGGVSSNTSPVGGLGGVGSSGDYNLRGGRGGAGAINSSGSFRGGHGGESAGGFGGSTGGASVGIGAGISGNLYGGGASGSSANSTAAGAAGAAGIVIVITYF